MLQIDSRFLYLVQSTDTYSDGFIFGMQYPSIWFKFIDRDDDYAMYIQDREFDEYFKDPNAEFGLVPVKLNESFDFDN